MRLGVYVDLDYSSRHGTVFTDEPVIGFVAGLASRVEELVIFGRLGAGSERPYRVPSGARFVALPHYPSLFAVPALVRAARGSCATFGGELDDLDAVWLFGPHPLSLLFARIARRRGKAVFLGVRQDFPRYIARRLPSVLWAWAIPAAWLAEWAYRLLARKHPTIVVGSDLAQKYRRGQAALLATGFSLIRDDDIVSPDEALTRSWDGDLRVLSVGRLVPEKNPILLSEVLTKLRESDPRWRLAIAGDGPLAEQVRERAAELGVEDAIERLGYVPNGESLRAEYRKSHAFLHVSLTEGLPQVIFEAQAAGLPIVATDVGGVAEALDHGDAGLLVPPASASAASAAIRRLADEPELRERLIARGLERVSGQTVDAQLDRVASFMRDELGAATATSVTTRTVALMYHDVIPRAEFEESGFPGPLAARYKLEPDQFEAHLDAIHRAGVEVGLVPAGEGEAPALAITFDDGGSCSLAVAEVLERHGWRGHFFVVTSLLGTPGFLNADEARELDRRGHVVGSHSHSHPDYISHLSHEKLDLEWEHSRESLADVLGRPPSHASVPGGDVSPGVVRAVERAGYGLLMTSEPRARIERVGTLRVCGRYAIRASTTPRTALAYARGRLIARGRQTVVWKAKRAIKGVSPRVYERVRSARRRPS